MISLTKATKPGILINLKLFVCINYYVFLIVSKTNNVLFLKIVYKNNVLFLKTVYKYKNRLNLR